MNVVNKGSIAMASVIGFSILTVSPQLSLRTSSFIVTAPPDSTRPAFAGLSAIDCSPTGGCLAVGTYQSRRSPFQPMAVMRSSGRWGRARSLSLPSAASSSAYATLSAVGCSDARDCLAVGAFTTNVSPGVELPLAIFEVGGHWQQGRPIVLPPNAVLSASNGAIANGISCVASSCTIVGTYSPKTGGIRAFAGRASFAGFGRLSRTQPLPFSPPAVLRGRSTYESLAGLDCTASTRCEAVGSVSSVDGSLSVAITQAEIAGAWQVDAAAPLPPLAQPASVNSWLRGVACTYANACLAVGAVQTVASGEISSTPLVASLGTGVWVSEGPPAAPSGTTAGLVGVACRPSGVCVAAGVLTFPDGSVQGAVDAGTTSSLTIGVEAQFPKSVQGAPDTGGLQGISCPPSGSCVAAGQEALLDGHISVYDLPVITTIASN